MYAGLIALLVAGFIGGQTPFFLKTALREFPPLLVTFLRFGIASLVMLPFFLKSNEKLEKKVIKEMVKVSLFFAGNVAIFGVAIQYTSAIVSQVLYSISPLFVGILSYYILKEKFTKEKIIGAFVAFLGVSILVGQSFFNSDALSFGTPFGNLLTLCAVFSWSLFFVFSKKLVNKYSPIATSFVNYVVTALLLVIFVIIEQKIRPFNHGLVTHNGIESILTMGIVSSAVMFFLIQFAIKRTSAFLASLYQFLGPPSAVVTAVPFLGEKLTWNLALSGILIIFGVFYATSFQYIKKK